MEFFSHGSSWFFFFFFKYYLGSDRLFTNYVVFLAFCSMIFMSLLLRIGTEHDEMKGVTVTSLKLLKPLSLRKSRQILVRIY